MDVFIALVIKDKLEGGQSSHDVVLVEAEDQPSAVAAITRHEWPQSYWVEGKSVCRTVKIIKLGSLNSEQRSILLETPSRDLERVYAGSSPALTDIERNSTKNLEPNAKSVSSKGTTGSKKAITPSIFDTPPKKRRRRKAR